MTISQNLLQPTRMTLEAFQGRTHIPSEVVVSAVTRPPKDPRVRLSLYRRLVGDDISAIPQPWSEILAFERFRLAHTIGGRAHPEDRAERLSKDLVDSGAFGSRILGPWPHIIETVHTKSSPEAMLEISDIIVNLTLKSALIEPEDSMRLMAEVLWGMTGIRTDMAKLISLCWLRKPEWGVVRSDEPGPLVRMPRVLAEETFLHAATSSLPRVAFVLPERGSSWMVREAGTPIAVPAVVTRLLTAISINGGTISSKALRKKVVPLGASDDAFYQTTSRARKELRKIGAGDLLLTERGRARFSGEYTVVGLVMTESLQPSRRVRGDGDEESPERKLLDCVMGLA